MLLGNIGELFIGYMSLDTVYWRSFVLENILLSLSYWVYWWGMLWYWRRFHIGDQCVCNHVFFFMGFAFCADAVVALLTVGVSMFTQKLQRRKTQ